MIVEVAVEAPLVSTPAFDVWRGPDGSSDGRAVWPGLGLAGTGVLRTYEHHEWFVGLGVRGDAALWDDTFATTAVASTYDLGWRTRSAAAGAQLHPSFALALGLGATTLHASAEGTLTAFSPHLSTEGAVAIGTGPVRVRLALRADALARTDGWGAYGPDRSWYINAGRAAVRFLVGVEYRVSE